MAQRSQLERAVERTRAALRRRDARTSSEVIRAYTGVYQQIKAEVAKLTGQIEALREQGKEVPLSWLYSEKRLARLDAAVVLEINRFAPIATASIQRAQRDLIETGKADAQGLAGKALGRPPPGVTIDDVWASLPTRAVEAMVATTGSGSPVRKLIDRLAGDAASRVRRTMVNHVALGRNPRVTARRITDDLGSTLDRALTIARTESLRALRLASQASMAANPEVVQGWTWVCALDDTTCEVCYAMHGEEFDSDEMLDTHPNCRCTMVPKTASWASLGFAGAGADEQLAVESGAGQFAKLSEAQQARVLGPAKLAAYKAGAVELKDFVQVKTSPTWGKSRSAKSLRAVLGKDAEKFYRSGG